MHAQNAQRSRRLTTISDRPERGGAMVEFALLSPLVVMMLLGVVTLGLSFNHSNSLNNGARESARYAATLPVADDLDGWLNSVADVARVSAGDHLATGVPGQGICVSYVYPDGTESEDRSRTVIEVNGVRTLSSAATCFDDGRPSSERRVQIAVSRTSQLQTGVYTKDLKLGAQSVARFERA